MNAAQRIWGATVACTALALGATACSSSSTPAASGTVAPAATTAAANPASGADPLAGMSLTAIMAKTKADMLGLKSVRSVASFKSQNSAPSWDFREAPGRGCAGSLSMGAGSGTIHMVVGGNKAWIKLDDVAWKTMGGGVASLRGKYFATSSTSGQFASMTQTCDLTKTMAQHMDDTTGLTKGSVVTAAGGPALQIKGPDGVVILVSDTATPDLLSITKTGSDAGSITFSDFDQPIDLTPPPASQVVSFPGA